MSDRFQEIMSRKLTLEQVQLYFSQSGAKIVGPYISYDIPIEFVCQCGRTHQSLLGNVRRGGAKCRNCAIVDRANSNRYPKEKLISFVKDCGYEIIDVNYHVVADKIKLRCPNHHDVVVSVRSFLQNNGRCKQCFYERNRGENSIKFKHGLSREEKYNRNKCRIEHNVWKKALLQKYHFACAICGKQDGKKLCAHHLNGYNWDIDHRYDIDNGIILCKHHHDEFHSIYGKGDNTKQQFVEFLQKCNKNFII